MVQSMREARDRGFGGRKAEKELCLESCLKAQSVDITVEEGEGMGWGCGVPLPGRLLWQKGRIRQTWRRW